MILVSICLQEHMKNVLFFGRMFKLNNLTSFKIHNGICILSKTSQKATAIICHSVLKPSVLLVWASPNFRWVSMSSTVLRISFHLQSYSFHLLSKHSLWFSWISSSLYYFEIVPPSILCLKGFNKKDQSKCKYFDIFPCFLDYWIISFLIK